MLEKRNALLVDIGNSQIKYAFVDNQEPSFRVYVTANTDNFARLMKDCNKVVISCVGDPRKLEHIVAICAAHEKPVQIIKTQASTFGIECAYEHYHTLGVDRWLAILAARQITGLPVAILDLGTANTCDFVIGNRHIGGWISPGFSLMRDSLTANTQRVFANQDFPSGLAIGQSTEECVNMGCVAAIQGFVMAAQHQLEQQGSPYQLIVTGGAKNLLGGSVDKHIVLEENLVLKGLARYL